MAQQSDFSESKVCINEGESSLSIIVKEFFCEWLSDGNTKSYPPPVYLDCMDKVSVYLVRRKISKLNLWEITNFGLFKSVYNKAINDNLFKATNRNMHRDFVQVGKAFLKFLKSKTDLHKVLAVDCQLAARLTIRAAIVCVLEAEQQGMTVEQICNKIIANKLYSFSTKNPQNVLRVELEYACEKSSFMLSSPKKFFRFERNHKGEKVYFLLSSILADEISRVGIIVNGEPSSSESVGDKHNNIEIWNTSIKRDFQAWMESEKYAQTTIKIYCCNINQIIHNFKPLADIASNESVNTLEAVHKFVTLLGQEKKFTVANKMTRSQFSTALAVFVRFVGRDTLIHKENSSLIEFDDIIDIEEGKAGIRGILDNHFLTLDGYSNVGLLWSAAQNALSMFLNDNAINTSDVFGRFLVRAFKNEFVFSLPHIWQNEPDYPQNSRGLIINLARRQGGVVTREQIDSFFSRIKLRSLYNSFILDKGQLLFYDKEKFILNEMVNCSDERCTLIAKELNMLFSCENTPFIILRDISSSWFSRLPELPNGLQWTPLLLQELLRICPETGYRIISPDLKGQALDTVGAAIVQSTSEINSFADIVHRFSYEKYTLPIKLSAEELRLKLREVGMIEGNELIYNMHKALKDYRFAFSDENHTVMILER